MPAEALQIVLRGGPARHNCTHVLLPGESLNEPHGCLRSAESCAPSAEREDEHGMVTVYSRRGRS